MSREAFTSDPAQQEQAHTADRLFLGEGEYTLIGSVNSATALKPIDELEFAGGMLVNPNNLSYVGEINVAGEEDAWIGIFRDTSQIFGAEYDPEKPVMHIGVLTKSDYGKDRVIGMLARDSQGDINLSKETFAASFGLSANPELGERIASMPEDIANINIVQSFNGRSLVQVHSHSERGVEVKVAGDLIKRKGEIDGGEFSGSDLLPAPQESTSDLPVVDQPDSFEQVSPEVERLKPEQMEVFTLELLKKLGHIERSEQPASEEERFVNVVIDSLTRVIKNYSDMGIDFGTLSPDKTREFLKGVNLLTLSGKAINSDRIEELLKGYISSPTTDGLSKLAQWLTDESNGLSLEMNTGTFQMARGLSGMIRDASYVDGGLPFTTYSDLKLQTLASTLDRLQK